MIYKHNNIKNVEIRNSNERFNQDYITSLNLDFDIYKYEGFNIGNDSIPYFTVWLKNIDRLFSLLPKSSFNEYNLLDIGCGLGISTNYIKKHYKFNSYCGVDISNDLIKVAKKLIIIYQLIFL